MREVKLVPVGAGTATYASGGSVQWLGKDILGALSSAAKGRGRMVTGLLLRVTLVVTNAAGAATLARQRAQAVLDQLTVSSPDGTQPVSLTSQAGYTLGRITETLLGRLSEPTADVSLTATADTTVVFDLEIPFRNRGRGKRDFAVDPEILAGWTVTAVWANGAASQVFDANNTIKATSTFALYVVSEDSKIAKRLGVPFEIKAALPASTDAPIPGVAGRRLYGLVFAPKLAANALTAPGFTTSDFTGLQATIDGRQVLGSNGSPDEAIGDWNRNQARSTADQLARFASGASGGIPIVSPTGEGKLSDSPRPTSDPQLTQVGGSPTVANQFAISCTLKGSLAYAAAVASRLGWAFDPRNGKGGALLADRSASVPAAFADCVPYAAAP